MLLSGCASAPNTGGGSADGLTNTPAHVSGAAPQPGAPSFDDDPLGISRSAQDLERQAHADAAWLEERRQAAAQRSAAATEGSAAPPPSASPPADAARARRPEVFFNDPPAARSAESNRSAAGNMPALGTAEATLGGGNDSAARTEVNAVDPDRAISAASDDFAVLLVRLRQELMEQSHRSSQPLRELIAMSTMAIIDPEFRLEPDAFRGLTDSEREQLGHFQSFFSRLGRTLDGSTHADEVLIEAVASLREALSPLPELVIRTAELCHSVDGFGRFTPFDPRRFLAMDEQEAIIYLEIEGLHATRNEGGDWVTRLSQEVQIFGSRDRIPVWSEPWQSTVDRTVNQRRDFYTVWLIRFPRALSTGEYFLKIRVRDDQSQAEAETSITFEMVADPRMTGRPVRK